MKPRVMKKQDESRRHTHQNQEVFENSEHTANNQRLTTRPAQKEHNIIKNNPKRRNNKAP
eukprot:scaffold26926_cov52-Attheya_sp.AAC.2